jgi:hypothetical protein
MLSQIHGGLTKAREVRVYEVLGCIRCEYLEGEVLGKGSNEFSLGAHHTAFAVDSLVAVSCRGVLVPKMIPKAGYQRGSRAGLWR